MTLNTKQTVNFLTADSLVVYAGERFDFVLAADQSKALYWMRFRGLMDCDERYQKAFQVAVLEYSNYYAYVPEGNQLQMASFPF